MDEEIHQFKKGLDNLSALLKESVGNNQNNHTDRETIFKQDKVRLYRYNSNKVQPAARPAVLIVYALVNRPYILDLQQNRSLIGKLLELGLDIYLLDWGYPDQLETHKGLDAYLCGYLDSAVDALREHSGQARISLIGVCQGGTLSLCYTALYVNKIRSLLTLVTPVDFHAGDNLLTNWSRHIDIDRMLKVFGNIPGSYLNTAFQSLKPVSNTVRKYLDFVLAMSNDRGSEELLENFCAMEQWLSDTPDQPGTLFSEFINTFYRENRFIEGGLTIGGREVNLRNIDLPVLNIYASQDHIVPSQSSIALGQVIGSNDYQLHAVETGHIGIFVGRSSLQSTPALMAGWIHQRSP